MSKPTLQDVWMMIPDSGCIGACQEACTAIGMSRAEHRMLNEVLPGFPFSDEMSNNLQYDPDYRCPALVEGRCTVYDVRPTVCRIWGSADSVPCPWGCVPRGGRLSEAEASSLFHISLDIGGGVAARDE